MGDACECAGMDCLAHHYASLFQSFHRKITWTIHTTTALWGQHSFLSHSSSMCTLSPFTLFLLASILMKSSVVFLNGLKCYLRMALRSKKGQFFLIDLNEASFRHSPIHQAGESVLICITLALIILRIWLRPCAKPSCFSSKEPTWPQPLLFLLPDIWKRGDRRSDPKQAEVYLDLLLAVEGASCHLAYLPERQMHL